MIIWHLTDPLEIIAKGIIEGVKHIHYSLLCQLPALFT
jgi:hypothetical protein